LSAPFGLHEFAIELLQAGFHPSHEVLLQSKIEYIVQTAIEAVAKKCRIPIAESLEAFIVPGLEVLDWLVNLIHVIFTFRSSWSSQRG